MENIKFLFPIIGNVIRYFIIAGVAFAIFYIAYKKYFVANKIQSRNAQKKDFLRDILSSLQTIIITGLMVAVILFSPLREHTLMYEGINDYPIIWIPISILLALVAHDTYFYWMHRMAHHPKLFKYVHLTHHKSNNPSPWTSYSFGLIEGVLEALIIPIVLFLIPMHTASLMVFGMIAFFINVYGHLGYEIMPRGFNNSFLFKIINTSVHHNLHHEKFKGNYGLYFRIWDRLMKTENPEYEESYKLIQQQRFQKK
jgi:lathosterol oxidase